LSFSELLDQTRMEVAKTMLVDERATVTNVGYDVGYSDPANFCRSFRRLNGMSPTQYRKSIVQQYAPSPN
ncbi:MAG: AraC family transcriptional regulator, partial [Roseobacter sp.]